MPGTKIGPVEDKHATFWFLEGIMKLFLIEKKFKRLVRKVNLARNFVPLI